MPLDTYKRHLRGWLTYAFASEVFVIVSLTLFLPICLEQFARDNGFLLPAKTIPCSHTNLADVPENARCVVKIGWAWIDSASFSLYVYSISVFLQALTVISMGGIADRRSFRKRVLLCFAFNGAGSAALFLLLPSSSSLWLLCAPLAVLANVGFGASVVAMNAYLPMLAKESPEVVTTLKEMIIDNEDNLHASHENDDFSAPLLTRTSLSSAQRATYDSTLSTSTARISSLGIALGYVAGILLLLLALVPVTKLHGSTWSLRLAIGLSGIWWGVGSVAAGVWLPKDKEQKNVMGEVHETESREWSVGGEIVNAWKRLGGMLRPHEIRKLKNTFKYLGAWFLLSDGFTTMTSTALLFAKTTLHLSPSSLILIGVLTPSAGILGALIWPRIQKHYEWSNLRVLVLLVGLASMIPAYGCLGFLPVFSQGKVKFGGLTTEGEMYALALYFGCVYGAFQSYARAFYAELLPPGEEARWYGLFSITDKSSSFLGPLIVGVIADTTGNIRYSFFFLVFMIWAAMPILWSVDVERGRKDAQEYQFGVIGESANEE